MYGSTKEVKQISTNIILNRYSYIMHTNIFRLPNGTIKSIYKYIYIFGKTLIQICTKRLMK